MHKLFPMQLQGPMCVVGSWLLLEHKLFPMPSVLTTCKVRWDVKSEKWSVYARIGVYTSYTRCQPKYPQKLICQVRGGLMSSGGSMHKLIPIQSVVPTRSVETCRVWSDLSMLEWSEYAQAISDANCNTYKVHWQLHYAKWPYMPSGLYSNGVSMHTLFPLQSAILTRAHVWSAKCASRTRAISDAICSTYKVRWDVQSAKWSVYDRVEWVCTSYFRCQLQYSWKLMSKVRVV
jgi:hypothetical protein